MVAGRWITVELMFPSATRFDSVLVLLLLLFTGSRVLTTGIRIVVVVEEELPEVVVVGFWVDSSRSRLGEV